MNEAHCIARRKNCYGASQVLVKVSWAESVLMERIRTLTSALLTTVCTVEAGGDDERWMGEDWGTQRTLERASHRTTDREWVRKTRSSRDPRHGVAVSCANWASPHFSSAASTRPLPGGSLASTTSQAFHTSASGLNAHTSCPNTSPTSGILAERSGAGSTESISRCGAVPRHSTACAAWSTMYSIARL